MFGSQLGKIGGNFLGGVVGRKFGNRGAGSRIGESIGEVVGGLLPFKKGGRVKKTGPALLHKNEYVLPAGVPPTKGQKAVVAKNKAKAKKHKKPHK